MPTLSSLMDGPNFDSITARILEKSQSLAGVDPSEEHTLDNINSQHKLPEILQFLGTEVFTCSDTWANQVSSDQVESKGMRDVLLYRNQGSTSNRTIHVHILTCVVVLSQYFADVAQIKRTGHQGEPDCMVEDELDTGGRAAPQHAFDASTSSQEGYTTSDPCSKDANKLELLHSQEPRSSVGFEVRSDENYVPPMRLSNQITNPFAVQMSWSSDPGPADECRPAAANVAFSFDS